MRVVGWRVVQVHGDSTLGFRVEGSGFRVEGLRFRILGSGFRVEVSLCSKFP